MCRSARVGKAAELPQWIGPQLTRVADDAPAGDDWLHEIKYDGYRMHARLDRGKVQLLTRTGLDWSRRYQRLAGVLRPAEVKRMPLDKPPPRETWFGSPLELSRVHWVQPKVVVEVTYLTWTEGGLLRAVGGQSIVGGQLRM